MTIKKQSVFVFDVDDTIGWLSLSYDRAYLEYFNYLYKEVFIGKAPSLHQVYKKFFEIDRKNADDGWGIKRGRVAQSMIDQYRGICDWLRVDINTDHERVIREIGDKPFDLKEWRWVDGAEETLGQLRDSGDKLCVLTCYEKSLFEDKSRMHGFERYFQPENTRVIHSKKTRDDFILVSGWTPELDDQFQWYAIGNGESDIRPALGVSDNWRGLYIGHKTTSPFFDETDSTYDPKPMSDSRVDNPKSIREILDYI